MSEHEDEFCPECGANVGPGTLDSIGCPLCGYSEDDEEDVELQKFVLRITRHETDEARTTFLREVFGDVEILTEDFPYGENPLATVRNWIEIIQYPEGRARGQFAEVVAVEAQAPFPVLLQLVGKLEVPLIRAQFERGEDGRAIVVGQDEGGRDLLKFSHYEELVRLEFETRRLEPR